MWLKKHEIVFPIWHGRDVCRIGRVCLQLVRTWWQADRVRGMLGEGRILRLNPPALIVYEGRQVEVVGYTRDAAEVFYDCRADAGPVQVRVALVGPTAAVQITWIERGEQHLLAESDLEIWEMLAPTEIVK